MKNVVFEERERMRERLSARKFNSAQIVFLSQPAQSSARYSRPSSHSPSSDGPFSPQRAVPFRVVFGQPHASRSRFGVPEL